MEIIEWIGMIVVIYFGYLLVMECKLIISGISNV